MWKTILLVFILFILPLVSAVDYDDVYVYGNDNLPGYIREWDRLKVDITGVEIDGVDPVTAYYLTVKKPSGEFLFSTCSGSPADCTYITDEQTRSPGTYTGWKVRLYNSTVHNAKTFQMATYPFGYVVDILAPIITFNTLEQNNRNVRIFYSVEDDDGSSGTDCAGIKEVEIVGKLSDAAGINSINYTFYDYDCALRVDKTLGQEITDSELISKIGVGGNNVQDIRICIQARDKLGQPDNIEDNRVCKDLNYDLKKPDININTFFIRDSGGNPVETLILYNTLSLTATVNITEDSALTVAGDFSALNENLDEESPTSCTLQENNIHTCTWSFSVLNPSLDLNVELNATDNWGNSQIATKGFGTTAIDNDAPVVLWIRSDKIINGVSYLKLTDNRITVRLLEEGSGFEDENIILSESTGNRLIPVGSGKPNSGYYRNCTAPFAAGEGTVIDCTWKGVNVSSSVLDRSNFVLTVNGGDDVGNAIDDSACSQVMPNECTSKIDKAIPDIRSASFIEEGLSIGDSFTISVELFEDGSGFDETTYTYANITGNCNLNKQADSCTNISARYLWNCVWNGNINDESCFTSGIEIIITDRVDNKAKHTTGITETGIPEITFFNTSFDGWIGDYNTIQATIYETGSGINQNNVLLNENAPQQLRINHGFFLVNRNPDFCDNNIGTINCYWYNLTCDDCNTEDIITLELSVTDNSGQTVTEEAAFKVDLTPPELVPNSTVIMDVQSRRTDFIASGGSMEAVANVTELMSGEVTAYLNLTEFGLSDNVPATECFNTSTMWRCRWQSIAIPDIAGLGLNVKFNFLDKALNKLTLPEPIDVLAPVDVEGENLSYMLTKVDVIKDSAGEDMKLSRRILATSDRAPIFYDLLLEKIESGKNIKIIEKSVDCNAKEDTYASFLKGAGILFGNLESDYKEDIVTDTLRVDIGGLTQTEAENLPGLDIDCELVLKVKKKGEAVVLIDKLGFNISPEFYRTPFDDVPMRIFDELNKSKISWVEDTQWMDDWDKGFQMLRSLCVSFSGFSSAYQFLQYFKAPIWGVSQAFGLPGLWTAYASVVQAVHKLKDKIWNFFKIDVTKYGDFVRTLAGGADEVGVFKLACAGITCQQCYDPEYTGLWLSGLRKTTEEGGQTRSQRAAEWLSDKFDKDYGIADFTLIGNLSDPISSPYVTVSLSPERSIITAVSCLCLPAIVQHIQRYRQINCKYIRCLKDSSISVFDKGLCSSVRSQEECIYIFGSIFNAFNIKEPLQRITSLIHDFLRVNPYVRLGSYVKNSFCEDVVGIDALKAVKEITATPWQSIACGYLDASLLAGDFRAWFSEEYWDFIGEQFMQMIERFKEPYNILFGDNPDYVNECDGVYCEKDSHCNDGEKCIDGLCFLL